MIGILVDADGNRRIYYESDTGMTEFGPIVEKDLIYLRTTNDGYKAQFHYSSDGEKYVPFGPIFQTGSLAIGWVID